MKLPIYTLLCSRIVRALLRGFLMTRNCHGINDDSAFVVRNQPPPCRASLVSVEASRDLTRSHNCVFVFSAATHADAKRVLFVLNVRHRRREPRNLSSLSWNYFPGIVCITAAVCINQASSKNSLNYIYGIFVYVSKWKLSEKSCFIFCFNRKL